jgi:hypothetical protein
MTRRADYQSGPKRANTLIYERGFAGGHFGPAGPAHDIDPATLGPIEPPTPQLRSQKKRREPQSAAVRRHMFRPYDPSKV